MKRRFFVSLVVTVPILLLSPMIQQWFGFRLEVPARAWIIFLLSTFIYLYGGWPFLSGMLTEIRRRKPGMMTLISLAISVAYFYSAVTLVIPGGKEFFWELATLIDIMLIGHYIEAKSVMGAANALQKLVQMMPKNAQKLLPDGTTETVPVDRLAPGDLILVRPGETIPADGSVQRGESLVNEAFLTGESTPVAKKPGSDVYMGSGNLDGALEVRVGKSGAESYLSQVIALVEEAQESRSRTQDMANRAAGWLFYAAGGTGAVTFAVWSAIASPMEAVLRTVTVLIIACPHALGLAVPLVTAISTSLAARRGILIRDRQAFESLRRVDVVCFDKTGTLTEGRLAVSRFAAVAEEKALLGYALSIERNSEHIIARAIVEHAQERGAAYAPAESFVALPGIGARAKIGGHEVTLGGPRLLEQEGLKPPAELERYLETASTKVWVVVDGAVEGVFLLEDRIREDSREALSSLKRMGIETWMLTGDNEAVAQAVARAVGIDHYRAGMLPDEKLRQIHALREKGKRVAMVGDGINDAPSLLAADVGIAIGAGTDIAIDSADIILTRSEPTSVVHAIRLSRATTRKMVQNLWWASGYNLVAIPLAAGVMAPWGIVIDPAVGAILMSLSTVIVALNAQLLRRA
jgi:Cu2+-exporting ATPase